MTSKITNAQKSEETKQALINSALQIISSKGYAKTTLDDISKNIGMTRGAFYWHFKNKREVLLEIEKQYEQLCLRDYGNIPVFESAYETLKQLMMNQIDQIFGDEFISYSFIIKYRIESLTEMPDLMEKQISLDNFSRNKIAEQIQRGIDNNEFKEVNVNEIASSLFALIIGCEDIHMLHPNEHSYCDEVFKSGAIHLLDSIRK